MTDTQFLDRFPTAASSGPPTQEQKDASNEIRDAVVNLARVIDQSTAPSRDQSLALTHLEDVLMRANRALFNPPTPKEAK